MSMSGRDKQSYIVILFIFLVGVLCLGVGYIGKKILQRRDANKMPPATPVAVLKKRWPEIIQHAIAPPWGPAKAPYTLVEFGDFECSQCANTRPIIELSLFASHGKANLYFVQRPIPEAHKWANESAEAAEVAADYHKFWPMYDTLYTNQENLDPRSYGDYASEAGINETKFQQSYSQPQYAQRVKSAYKFASSLGITVTPTLLFHDNKTGNTGIYRGKNQITQFLSNAPWLTPSSAVAGKS
jgi:protein-disulfide isomerase